jgi:Uma2 family endonuclease
MATPADIVERALMPAELAERMPHARLLLSDEPQMESPEHYEQLALLTSTLQWAWRERSGFFIGANLSIYYDRNELTRRRFCGPDLFVVNAAEPAKRNSWVVWEEGGRYPDLIIELLSDSTAATDRNGKKRLYQDVFRTPEYFWFHPITLEFEGFRLSAEHRYEPIPPDASGHRLSEALQMRLGVHERQLRFFDLDGALIPTPAESALQEQAEAEAQRQIAETERARADAERARAEAERQRADALADRLRAAGLDPGQK